MKLFILSILVTLTSTTLYATRCTHREASNGASVTDCSDGSASIRWGDVLYTYDSQDNLTISIRVSDGATVTYDAAFFLQQSINQEELKLYYEAKEILRRANRARDLKKAVKTKGLDKRTDAAIKRCLRDMEAKSKDIMNCFKAKVQAHYR